MRRYLEAELILEMYGDPAPTPCGGAVTYLPFHNLPHVGPLQTWRMPAGLCFTESRPLGLGKDFHSPGVWSRLAGYQPQMNPQWAAVGSFLSHGLADWKTPSPS